MKKHLTKSPSNSSAVNQPIQKKSNNTGLPNQLKSGIENLSGYSMDDVKVHYNSSKPAQLHAHAYAQGNQIHLASGQEKHLPHEAWHVVQQKQGRVKPTIQLKSNVPVNDDPGLEKEADEMGAKAGSGNTSGHVEPAQLQAVRKSGSTVQLQNAQQAGMLGAYVAGAPNVPLYNARGGIGLPNGIRYTHALPAVPAAAGTGGVLDAYMVATRPYAGPLAGSLFLDSRNNPQAPPNAGNWAVQGANYINVLENWLQAPANSLAAMTPANGGTQANAVLFRNNLVNNRNALRSNAGYGLIDPFITELTIPVVGAAAPWIIQTSFSHASFGYIIDINVGPHNVHGHIAANPAAFTAVAGAVPALGAQHIYSPGHDLADLNTVGNQINTIAPGATHGHNHLGLDAITKLAAEGARFEPVRQLGTNLRVNSRFFSLDHHTNQVKYLNFITLYQRWGNWFNRAYGINAAAVQAQVIAHGVVLNNTIDLANDYDTDAGQPAHLEVANYNAHIAHLLQTISDARQQKINYARGKGPRQQQAVAAYNRGRNQIIDLANYNLGPYNRMVPQLVHAIRHPAPPVVAVVPAVVPAAAGPAAAPPANNNLRNILIAGAVVLTAIAAGAVGSWLRGRNGFLFSGNHTS